MSSSQRRRTNAKPDLISAWNSTFPRNSSRSSRSGRSFPAIVFCRQQFRSLAEVSRRSHASMLSRKQQWRRVKSRRRETRSVQPSNPSQGKSSASGDKDENANSDDEVTTPRTGSPSISPYSSFESVQSALGEPEERSTTAKSVPTSYPRGKGVTFEPEVKVYLVFRDELDDR